MKTLMLAILASLCACSRTDVDAANKAAKAFVKNIDGATGVVCADTDTDGDGYVSCTVFMGKGVEPMQIQCGSETICINNCARGCKYEPSVKIRGRARNPE